MPGSFFLVFGIWWSFITAIRYVQSGLVKPTTKKSGSGGGGGGKGGNRDDELANYRGSVTMPCICLPCGSLRRAPLESILKGLAAFIGLMGEIITGVHFYTKPVPLSQFAGSAEPGGHDMSHVHRRHADHEMPAEPLASAPMTPAGPVPAVLVTTWHMEYTNSQHVTMYATFLLGSIVEILLHYKWDLPRRLDIVCGIMAFGIEGFLFAFHLHSRHALDIHVHTLLVYAIMGCAVFAALEFYDQTQILYTYGRILCTILQGTWFYEVGFILYPPWTSPAFQWDHDDHNQMMIVTMSFCWHVILIFVGLLIQLGIIKCIYKRCRYVSDQWDELIAIDEANHSPYGARLRMGFSELVQHDDNDCMNMTETAKFLSGLNSEDDNDERVEFDTNTRMIKTKHAMNSVVGAAVKSTPSSNASSTTSGNYSLEMR